MLPVAILGAGLAGLAAARVLVAAGQPARLFDKGRAPGGRLATRRVSHAGAEHRFDHGAQYLRAERAPFAALPGMSAIGRQLATWIEVATGVTVSALREAGAGWRLHHEGGTEGPFAAVLVTMPAPQAVALRAALPAPEPLFAQAHRWRFALPEAPLGEACLLEAGLGDASDGCLGGGAEAAFESGTALAARWLAHR